MIKSLNMPTTINFALYFENSIVFLKNTGNECVKINSFLTHSRRLKLKVFVLNTFILDHLCYLLYALASLTSKLAVKDQHTTRTSFGLIGDRPMNEELSCTTQRSLIPWN